MEFDYLLCIGVVNGNFEVVNNCGELDLIPILDVNSEYNWEVLEDSPDENLKKQIEHFLENER